MPEPTEPATRHRLLPTWAQTRVALLGFGLWHINWAIMGTADPFESPVYRVMQDWGGVALWATVRGVVGIGVVAAALVGNAKAIVIASYFDMLGLAFITTAFWVADPSSMAGFTYAWITLLAVWVHAGAVCRG